MTDCKKQISIVNHTMMNSAIITLLVILCLIFPIFGVFAASVCFTRKSININILFLLYFCFAFSLLLTLRNPEDGLAVGIGMDAQHYMHAFQQFIKNSNFDVKQIILTAVSNTGSGEPLFWILSYFLSTLFEDSINVWMALTFIGLIIISYPFFTIKHRLGFLSLALYVSTITFYVFPGSGFRQGLAFSFLYAALFYLSEDRIKLSLIYSVSALFIHASSLPVAMIIFMANLRSNFHKYRYYIVFGIIPSIILLYYFEFSQITEKFEGYQQYEAQYTAYIQSAIESVVLLIIYKKFKTNLNRKFGLALYLYILSLIAFAFLFTGSGFERYYRYLYIFSIYILVKICQIKNKFAIPIVVISLFWMLFILQTRYAEYYFNGGLVNHIFYSPFMAITKI